MNLKSEKMQNILIVFLSVLVLCIFTVGFIQTKATTNENQSLSLKPPIVSKEKDNPADAVVNESINLFEEYITADEDVNSDLDFVDDSIYEDTSDNDFIYSPDTTPGTTPDSNLGNGNNTGNGDNNNGSGDNIGSTQPPVTPTPDPEPPIVNPEPPVVDPEPTPDPEPPVVDPEPPLKPEPEPPTENPDPPLKPEPDTGLSE